MPPTARPPFLRPGGEGRQGNMSEYKGGDGMENTQGLAGRFDALNPFGRHNGLFAVSAGPQRAEMRARVGPQAVNGYGGAHGGFLFALADSCAGLLAVSDGRAYVTLDASFQFLRSPRLGDELTAVATPVRRGRTVLVARVALTGAEGRLMAEGTFTMYCTGEALPGAAGEK